MFLNNTADIRIHVSAWHTYTRTHAVECRGQRSAYGEIVSFSREHIHSQTPERYLSEVKSDIKATRHPPLSA